MCRNWMGWVCLPRAGERSLSVWFGERIDSHGPNAGESLIASTDGVEVSINEAHMHARCFYMGNDPGFDEPPHRERIYLWTFGRANAVGLACSSLRDLETRFTSHPGNQSKGARHRR